mgnify:CR=1 FL=1
MKIYYLNDESAPITIRLIGALPECKNTYVQLQPQEGRTFEIAGAKPDSIPFVKRWDNRTVLLSYMDSPKSDQTETSDKLSDT